MVIGKNWLDDRVYEKLVDCVRTMGKTRLFTQHMINHVVPKFNLIPDGYNWKVSPQGNLVHNYGITDSTRIIHWAGALPDKSSGRQVFSKPWEQKREENSLSELWYKYKDEMMEELDG